MTSQRLCERRQNALLTVFTLLTAALLLFFCSKCSPLYPLNDWPDANVFLSAGKGMVEGRVMYRDLYDHKGPLLFALHALCALISPDGFFGVWLMEIVFLTAFLMIAHKLIALYAGDRPALWALPLIALMLLTSVSFQMGDSAEELALPMMLYPVYRLMVSLRREEGRTTRWQLGVTGFLLGCVFWLKFTLVGIPAAVCLMLAWLGLRRDGLTGALKDIGWMLLGFAVSTLPWLIQYILQDALLPMLKTYLYDNLFLYAGAEEPLTLFGQLKAILKSILSWLRDNPGYTLPLLCGGLMMLLSKQHRATEKISWCLCAVFGLITVFFGGRYYLYYGFALGALLPLFFCALGVLMQGRREKRGADDAAVPASAAVGAPDRQADAVNPVHAAPACASGRKAIAVFAAILVLTTALSPFLSPNRPLDQPKCDQLMQYRFAEIINRYEDPTLLNYGFLDWGFYTAAGVAPHLKYYHLANMPLDELHSEQDRYVREGLSDFVVTRAPLREDLAGLYTLADTCPAPDGLWFTDVYLYRLSALEER